MKTTIILLSLILLQLLPAYGQQPTIEVLEHEFERIENVQASLNQKIQTIKESIAKNDAEIQKIKQNDEVSYLERQRLEGLLKESQSYSLQIEGLNENLNKQQVDLQKVGEKLIEIYDHEINALLVKLNDKSLGAMVRKTHYAALEIFRKKKSTVQEKIGRQTLEHFELNQLTINPEDSPKKIEQKADLLKDQEEKYRKIGKQYKSQITDLKKELNLRNRIDDLVTDLALFDQQEEAIGQTENSQSIAADETATPGDFTGIGTERSNVPLSNVLINQKDFDFNSLSDEQLEDVILRMEAERKNANSKADSLANQATLFYKKAKSMKKQ